MPDRGTVRSVVILVADAAGVADAVGAAGAGDVAGAVDCPAEAGGTAGDAAFGAPSCDTQPATTRNSGITSDTRTQWPYVMCCPFVRGTLATRRGKIKFTQSQQIGAGEPLDACVAWSLPIKINHVH